MWGVEAGMSLLFLVDLVLSFNTAYLVDGEWVRDREKIARTYIKGWFWIDAPSSVPVEFIELLIADGDAGSLAAFRVLRLARLVRLAKLLKIAEYVSRLEEEFDVNLRLLRVFQLIMLMAYMAHMMACGMFLMTTLAAPEEATWVDVYDDGSASEGPFGEQYLFSFYWAITTLVGAGGNIPSAQTDPEKIYGTCATVLRALFFAYVIGEIGTLLQALDRQAALVTQKMDTIKEYLQWRSIPRDLNIRIRRYYEYFYQTQAVFDEKTILAGLSTTLHGELVRTICKDTLGRLPLFAKLSPEFQSLIFPMLKPLSVAAGDVLFAKGTVSNELYFLLSGEVDVRRLLHVERVGRSP